METGEILKQLKQAVPGSVLEESSFGLTQQRCVWVDVRTLPQIASFLKNEKAIALDWLENLSTVQMDEALVVTYFLRSTQKPHTLILRASLMPGSEAKEVFMPSVNQVWRMAEPFEVEIQELFGVMFTDADGKSVHTRFQRLPKDWKGFPLRKSYIFPANYLGIRHARESGKGEQP